MLRQRADRWQDGRRQHPPDWRRAGPGQSSRTPEQFQIQSPRALSAWGYPRRVVALPMPESAPAVPDLRDAVPAHGATLPAPLPPALTDGRLFATCPEAAEVLRTDARTLRKALEAGKVPGTKVGEHWRVPVQWLREQAAQGTATA
jgi:excisionase family DNA binding protein